MARRLRGGTTVTLAWIARRLAMGSTGYLAQCLREAEGKKYAVLRDPFMGALPQPAEKAEKHA